MTTETTEQTPEEIGREFAQERKPKSDVPFDFFNECKEYMEFIDGYMSVKFELDEGGL